MTTDDIGHSVIWPPPTDAELPEPLLSYLHAYALGDLASHATAILRPGALYRVEPGWVRLYRYQAVAAAHDYLANSQAIARHLASLHVSDDLNWQYSAGVRQSSDPAGDALTTLLRDTGLAEIGPSPVPHGTPDWNRRWLEHWAADHPRLEPVVDVTPPAADQLWHLRLGMAEPAAVRTVVAAAGGGSFRPIPLGDDTTHCGLQLDLDRLADAFPLFDPRALLGWTDRALLKLHLFGLLDRQAIENLGLTPTDHPCGMDPQTWETHQYLQVNGQALTGRSVHVPVMVEWGRHEQVSWGEDEYDLFFTEDRPALEAAMADPWCVKRDDIENVFEFRLRD